jgi:putative sterol carrier protein
MPLHPFTPPWAEAVRDAINRSHTYRKAGAHWNAPVALVLQAAPHLGFPHDVALLLHLRAGKCHSATVLPARDELRAEYVLRAPYPTWKALVRGQLEPGAALLRGRVHLTRGSLPRLVVHARAARALVRCAADVDMVFPDESGPAPGGNGGEGETHV